MGEYAFSSTIAGFLAQGLCAEGRYEEAARFSRASEEAAAPDDVFSQMLWRTSRARIRRSRETSIEPRRWRGKRCSWANGQIS